MSIDGTKVTILHLIIIAQLSVQNRLSFMAETSFSRWKQTITMKVMGIMDTDTMCIGLQRKVSLFMMRNTTMKTTSFIVCGGTKAMASMIWDMVNVGGHTGVILA